MLRIALPCVSAAVLAGLAACSPPPPGAPAPQTSAVAPPAAAPMPAHGGGGLDGTYRPVEGYASGNARCGTTRFGYAIRVSNGIASMQTVSLGVLTGPVAPDGTLRIEQGRGLLQGQFTPGHFNGTYSYNNCAFTMDYAKR